MQREYVVPRIRETIPVVTAALIVAQQLVAEQGRYDLVRAAVTEIGDGVDQREGDELSIFHPGFDRVQYAEVLTIHRAHYGGI